MRSLKETVRREISIFILLRAMGLNSDKEIVNYIIQNDNDPEMLNILNLSIEESKRDGNYLILSTEDALNYIITKIKIQQKHSSNGNSNAVYLEKKTFIKYIFENAFIPHIESYKYDNCIRTKALFLCNMLNKLSHDGLLESAFDEESNDFIFWVKENENKKENS